jgi:hypothetical protein
MTHPPFLPPDTILLRLPLREDDDPDVWEARVLWTTRGAVLAVAAAALWPVLLIPSLGEDNPHPSATAFTRDDP